MLTLEEISAQLEIRSALQRYARGIDRRDAALALSAYWPDALDTRPYGPSDRRTLSAQERVGASPARFGALREYSQHHITNVTIELDLANDRAVSEAYLISFHPVGPESSGVVAEAAGGDSGGNLLSLVGGRFVDEFVHKDGEWRIQHRRLVVDFSRLHIPGEALFKDLDESLSAGAVDDPANLAFSSLE